jgi:hypothetical protein
MLRQSLEDEGLIAKKKKARRPSDDFDEGDGDGSGDSGNVEGDDDEAGGDDGEDDEGDEDEEVITTSSKQRHWIRVGDHHVYHPCPTISIAKRPTKTRVSAEYITNLHGAEDFVPAVQNYVSKIPQAQHHARLINKSSLFSVWTRCRLFHDPLPFAPLVGGKIDCVRAHPAAPNHPLRAARNAAFDTVLLEVDPDSHGPARKFCFPSPPFDHALIINFPVGYCAARVRAIFQLPLFCKEFATQQLAYVELFTPFTQSPRTHQHHLFQTKHDTDHGKRVTKIVPLSALRMACHLPPQYASLDASASITSAVDLLSVSHRFFLNRHSSYYFFSLMDYWRRPDRSIVSLFHLYHSTSPTNTLSQPPPLGRSQDFNPQ